MVDESLCERAVEEKRVKVDEMAMRKISKRLWMQRKERIEKSEEMC